MMDDEMIERVTEKLRTECLAIFGTTWNNDISKRFALVAIKAMREPTVKMLEPVTNADGFFNLSDPVQAWYKMIDAIIGDK